MIDLAKLRVTVRMVLGDDPGGGRSTGRTRIELFIPAQSLETRTTTINNGGRTRPVVQTTNAQGMSRQQSSTACTTEPQFVTVTAIEHGMHNGAAVRDRHRCLAPTREHSRVATAVASAHRPASSCRVRSCRPAEYERLCVVIVGQTRALVSSSPRARRTPHPCPHPPMPRSSPARRQLAA